MKDQKSLVALILGCLAICLSACAIVLCLSFNRPEKPGTPAPQDDGDVQYVLYLGTNDKDTNQPVFSSGEAKEILKDILIDYMGGYTIQEANGGWIDDAGTEYQEHTLVSYLSDTTEEDVHKLCDELIKTYDQSSILIQMNKTKTEFYSGSNQ